METKRNQAKDRQANFVGNSNALPNTQSKLCKLETEELNNIQDRLKHHVGPTAGTAGKHLLSNGTVNVSSELLSVTPKDSNSGDLKYFDDETTSHVSNVNEFSNLNHQGEIPIVVIPGDFDFIDTTHYTPESSIAESKKNSCGDESLNISLEENSKYHKPIPYITVPGDFNFADDTSMSSSICDNTLRKYSTDSTCKNSNDNVPSIISGNLTSNLNSSTYTQNVPPENNLIQEIPKCPKNIPNVVIPGDFDFIDDPNTSSISRERLHSTCSTGSKSKSSTEVLTIPVSQSANVDSTSLNTRLSNNSLCTAKNSQTEIPCVVIPGDFDFIDDKNASLLTLKDRCILNITDEQNPSPSKSDSFCLPATETGNPVIFKIPSIYLPSNVKYIDDIESFSGASGGKLSRGERAHSSFKIPRTHSTKRRLCRYHSDSETKTSGEVKLPRSRHHRSRSRKVRRCVSAIETKKDNYRTSVRRSNSDRSGMIVTGKHLRIPGSKYRPHSHYEGGSSRCSSTKTLSTNVSLSEIVAVEMGLKDIPGLTPKEARRKRIVFTVGAVTVIIIVVCVLLVAVTLLLSPEVDAVLRKGNEEIYRSMAAGASTSSPTTEEAAVIANNSTPPSGSPG